MCIVIILCEWFFNEILIGMWFHLVCSLCIYFLLPLKHRYQVWISEVFQKCLPPVDYSQNLLVIRFWLNIFSTAFFGKIKQYIIQLRWILKFEVDRHKVSIISSKLFLLKRETIKIMLLFHFLNIYFTSGFEIMMFTHLWKLSFSSEITFHVLI